MVFPMEYVFPWIQDRESLHVKLVLWANLLVCLFDIFALQAVDRGEKRELKEFVLMVDVPLALALVMGVVYLTRQPAFLSRTDQAKGLVAGLLAMQFLISALLFTIVETRLVSRLGLNEPATEASGSGD